MSKVRECPTEHQEQVAVIDWAAALSKKIPVLDYLFAVPNGGYRNKLTAIKLKREGVKRGVPDLMLPVPIAPYAGLFIEMKRRKGGALSKHQKEWFARLASVGYAVRCCNGADEAIGTITQYIGGVLK